MKNNKGITLVALVITIIVLLILAGVSISMVVGQNGILNRATNAAEKTSDAEVESALNTAVAGAEGDFVAVFLNNNNKYFLDVLQTENASDTTQVQLKADGYKITLKTASGTGANVENKKCTGCTIQKLKSGSTSETEGPVYQFDLEERSKMGAEVTNFKRQ